MVVVSLSETYDLSTKVGKVGLLGIHTPGNAALSKLWDGFMKNYRFVRIVGCDVTLACAQTLPADVLQVGEEAGDIAPQDMFNPILYKAVSNDSFNMVLARMYTLGPVNLNGIGSVSVGDLSPESLVTTEEDEFNMYYALLSESGWKKAMPQSGLAMRGLYPIVHQVLTNFGQMNNPSYNTSSYDNDLRKVPLSTDGDALTWNNTYLGKVIKGPSMRYPRMPTMTTIGSTIPEMSYQYTPFVKTYVGCVVLPPAKSSRLFYRMKIVWHFEFSEPRPNSEIANLTGLAQFGDAEYTSDYAEQSKKFENVGDTIDTNDLAVSKVMTSTR